MINDNINHPKSNWLISLEMITNKVEILGFYTTESLRITEKHKGATINNYQRTSPKAERALFHLNEEQFNVTVNSLI